MNRTAARGETPGRRDLQPPWEVQVAPRSLERFRDLLEPAVWQEFEQGIEQARKAFAGRVIWNVNSTAAGGGVAEMLRPFLAYARGAGIDVRWMVISGTPDFFRVTKRLHNFLHGSPGDGGALGDGEQALYSSVTAANAAQLADIVRDTDIVLLHDPQTAGMVPRLKQTDARVVWRSHIGAEQPNEFVETGWSFLEPWLEHADACVFSRHAYVPKGIAIGAQTEIIQPSIDAFSPKNQDIGESTQRAILTHVGLVMDGRRQGARPVFTRQDGTPGRVDRTADVISSGPPPSFDEPLVVQVSRWDRLKDPHGVIAGFAAYVAPASDAHLMLAGPSVDSVADDPEGAEVLSEVEAAWRAMTPAARSRVHLACLPMADIDENAAIVNALQRHATVVVQKSLMEGFGLTVAEAMWKSRPVLASAIGGIRDQIDDGVNGLLLEDPADLEAFGAQTLRLLGDQPLARELGQNAREKVRRQFLANRHALQYIRLFTRMLGSRV